MPQAEFQWVGVPNALGPPVPIEPIPIKIAITYTCAESRERNGFGVGSTPAATSAFGERAKGGKKWLHACDRVGTCAGRIKKWLLKQKCPKISGSSWKRLLGCRMFQRLSIEIKQSKTIKQSNYGPFDYLIKFDCLIYSYELKEISATSNPTTTSLY